MELVITIDKQPVTIKIDKNVIFFGKNSTYKNHILNTLVDGLTKNNKQILMNGKPFNPKDYNIITIDEETDFCNEFKFTKNNTLKQLIYDDITNKINEKKIVDYTNEIFDTIDDKVNRLLDKKINKKSENNISFQIEIPNIYSIIDRFTNIYIDDILLNDSQISKSMKRKLLYQLYFLDIQKQTDRPTFVMMNNFDAYLSTNEVINILNTINNLSNKNCHFILSSCNNIFEYLKIENYNIYKITNRLIPLEYLTKAIKQFLLKREFDKCQINFEKFAAENEFLISDDEISNIKNQIFLKHSDKISKILNSDQIKVVLRKPNTITYEYIVCSNKEQQLLFSEICDIFIDQEEFI